MHQAQGTPVTVSGSQARPFPWGEKKKKRTHRPMSVRTQPGPRFRTCCATTTADKNVVKRPRDLILGAEHGRNQQGATSFLGPYSRAARGGKQQQQQHQQHQHQHQQAKQQSASSPHSSRGSCLIFLGPQRQILQHRHRGHVAGPLPICPAYWPPVAQVPLRQAPPRSLAHHHHHTAHKPRRLSATLQRIAMGLDAWAPPGLECYGMTYLATFVVPHLCCFCFLASGLGTWSAALHLCCTQQ